MSAAIAPILAPAGFGDWEAAGSLVTGFIAKEVVVSTMSEIYAAGAEVEEEPGAAPSFVEDVKEIVTSFIGATVDTVKATISLIPGVDLMGEEEEEEEDTGLIRALQSPSKMVRLEGTTYNPYNECRPARLVRRPARAELCPIAVGAPDFRK